MFYALMRKDLRMLRPAIVGAVVIAFFFLVVMGGVSTYLLHRQAEAHNAVITSAFHWQQAAQRTWVMLGVSCGFAAIFAGAGAPIERRERWADFAAMLPVGGWQRTISRLIVAGTLSIALCGFHALLLVVCLSSLPDKWRPQDAYDAIPWTLAVAVAMFGLAWLGASFTRSPAINVSVAIAVVLGALIGIGEAMQGSRSAGPYEDFARVFFPAIAVIGVIATALGTVIAAYRVEP